MMTEVVRLGTVTGISWETGIIMMINRILVMAKRERKDRQLQKLEAQEKRCRKEKNRQTKRDMYETEEGCLSLDGVHVATTVRSLHII